MNLQRHAAALGKNFLQDTDQLVAFSLRDHSLLQGQVQSILILKDTVRFPEQVKLENAVFLQFQKNAVLRDIHELFRRILAG